ncbi:hypothetical protein R2083_13680 [Nitrosomonas sp. Is35]|uniref:hypothetical protein n=1 Tax=Nitrosomonas sp. Is35 TaxID=3080534 RepID=UPI00294ACD8B|nr:hypothetical protein [Nitrosomonas sp. Is35]MDV6348568.1 hypothetical protein [Nitrosomonas sp. Is35]
MPRRESGFVYLWALFSVVLAGVVMAGVGQVWQAKAQREKEAELLYVGEQFRKAIMSYYNTGTKQFPETLEELLEDKRTPAIKRHLRKIYMDPITNTAEWGIIDEPPPGGNTVSGNSPAASQNTTPGNNAVAGGNQASSSNQPSGNSLMPNTGQTSGSTTPNQASNNAAPSSSPGIGSNLTKRITGVYSLSEKKPIKKDKFPEQYAKFSEALTYRDWKFIYKPGEGSSASKPASTQSRPNTAPGASPSNSPFAPQSSSGAASPSSRSSSAGNASPFAPQSGAPASSSGFGMD